MLKLSKYYVVYPQSLSLQGSSWNIPIENMVNIKKKRKKKEVYIELKDSIEFIYIDTCSCLV